MAEDRGLGQRLGKRLQMKIHRARNDLGRLAGVEADEIVVGAHGGPDGIQPVVVELQRIAVPAIRRVRMPS